MALNPKIDYFEGLKYNFSYIWTILDKNLETEVDILDTNKIKIPQDVFDIAEERLLSNPSKYSGANFRCQFDIVGDNGGQWYILVDDKKKEVSKGVMENPISTLIMKEPDFIKLVHGQLNAPMALLTGKIKIKGDMSHIIKLAETLLA